MNTVTEEKEMVCIDTEIGWLVFAPAGTLTDEEREHADLHLSQCFACQIDVDKDYFLSRISDEKYSRP